MAEKIEQALLTGLGKQLLEQCLPGNLWMLDDSGDSQLDAIEAAFLLSHLPWENTNFENMDGDSSGALSHQEIKEYVSQQLKIPR